jgi:hypothetical protein
VTKEPENVTVTAPSVTNAKCDKASVTVADADRIRPGKIPLPGDADYVGVCEKVDGQWKVKDSEPSNSLKPTDLSSLPATVTDPTGSRTEATKAMTTVQLNARVSACKGADWINSPAYAELIHRLITLSLAELRGSGQAIPAWRANR